VMDVASEHVEVVAEVEGVGHGAGRGCGGKVASAPRMGRGVPVFGPPRSSGAPPSWAPGGPVPVRRPARTRGAPLLRFTFPPSAMSTPRTLPSGRLLRLGLLPLLLALAACDATDAPALGAVA